MSQLKLFVLVDLIFFLTFTSNFFSLVSAFGSDKSSLFTDSRCVVDLDRSRLTFVTPAADACPWVVLFYDSMCGHCREFAGPFAQLAEKYLITKGVLVGAVNCASNEAICTASNVTSVPAIMVGFPSVLSAINNNKLNGKLIQIREGNSNSDDNSQNNNNLVAHHEAEQKKMIDDLIRDASPYIKNNNNNNNNALSSASSSPTDVRKSNSHQKWRVVTNEISEDTPDDKLLDYVKKAVNEEVISEDFGENKNGMCREVVATLCLKKKKMIDFRIKNEKRKVKKPFSPPINHPCPQDLLGAFYISMKHEISVGFTSALTNSLLLIENNNQNQDNNMHMEKNKKLAVASSPVYQNLLRTVFDFLTSLHAAIPDLGANEVADILRKDALAPTKFDWGSKIYQILKQKHGGGDAQRIVFDERDEDEDGEEIKKKGRDVNNDLKSPPITSVVWSSCRGSSPNYRGYTCGLWMLFHTTLSSSQPRTLNKALRSIHNYVLNFFMCLECRVHFSQFRYSYSGESIRSRSASLVVSCS